MTDAAVEDFGITNLLLRMEKVVCCGIFCPWAYISSTTIYMLTFAVHIVAGTSVMSPATILCRRSRNILSAVGRANS